MCTLGLAALIRARSREKFWFCQLEVRSREAKEAIVGDGKYC